MGNGLHHVLADRPLDNYGHGTYPASAVTSKADLIYLFQHGERYPGFAYLVLSGSKADIAATINDVGSGSGANAVRDQIDPYDGRGDNDVSAQVTPAFKAVVDAAAAPLEAARKAAAESVRASVTAARAAHRGRHQG